MSFRYRSTTVTLENYRSVFKKCSPDILDEIRSAVLDDTAIQSFIKPCGNDNYKLGQLRMGVRELVPTEYLNPRLTGRTIYLIRQGISKGLDMSSILEYANLKGLLLDAETIEVLTEFALLGVDITSIDFTVVPKNLVEDICKGLYQGFPMWLCIDKDCKIDEKQLHLIKRGLQLGVDIHAFIDGGWSSEQMILLLSYAQRLDLNKFLSYVNNKFSTEVLSALLNLSARGIAIDTLCGVDSDGYPVHNQFQMFALAEGLEEGLVTDEMYNVNLSDMDIFELIDIEREKKNRKLNASLPKK